MRGDDKMIGKDSSEWLPAIDLNDPRLAYRQVDALRNAPDSVKKIFRSFYFLICIIFFILLVVTRREQSGSLHFFHSLILAASC